MTDETIARTSKDGVAAAIGVIDTSHRRGRDEILAAAVVLANALRAGFETLASPLCDGEVRVIYEHGEPHGVRDVSGYLCHFNRVPKFEGQEERYRRELALRARQAEAIATALRGTQAAVEAITDIKNAEIKRLQDLLMTRSSVPVEEICTPRVALKANADPMPKECAECHGTQEHNNGCSQIDPADIRGSEPVTMRAKRAAFPCQFKFKISHPERYCLNCGWMVRDHRHALNGGPAHD